MAYKTYQEQIESHLAFLRGEGLDVHELQVDVSAYGGFVRADPIGKSSKSKGGRGELAYKCTSRPMENGLIGLGTTCRVLGGERRNHSTYGYGPGKGEDHISSRGAPINVITDVFQDESYEAEYREVARKKAYGFWINCSETGESPYLQRKGVGSYGIRFKSSERHGMAAVVPMADIDGRLLNYQLLNQDGSKVFPKGTSTKGLFHRLQAIRDGSPIGIAESYVTAATCYEVTGIAMVCAFSSGNLVEISTLLRKRHPRSPILIFADNDRHLARNEGLEKAKEACRAVGENVRLLIPDFSCMNPGRDASDWNDLVQIYGHKEAFDQYTRAMSDVLPCCAS